MADDALRTLLLDLDHALKGSVPLIVAGGYGLYLKQSLASERGTRTLFATAALPAARTTEDVDLFLTAEIVVSPSRMKQVREALDSLGFTPIESARNYQFVREVKPAGHVKIDLLAGPLGALFDPVKVRQDERRVSPKNFSDLHAHPVPEAVAVEEAMSVVPLAGVLSNGESYKANVFVPQAFTYLLMKLFAFRDRAEDPRKDLGSHHALDVYRSVGLITAEEDALVKALAVKHRENPQVQEARRIVAQFFSTTNSLGLLRIREHPLYNAAMNLDQFLKELAALLPPLPQSSPRT